MSAPAGRAQGEVLLRAYAEFLEMPGLRLTVAQATRLLGADETSCTRMLDVLVDVGFLRRSDGCYSRMAEGPADVPVLKMVRRSLEEIAEARRPQAS